MDQTLLARQAIYNKHLHVVAYELLFRSRDINQSMNNSEVSSDEADIATANVLSNALIDIGLEQLVGKLPAHINFTQQLLSHVEQISQLQNNIVFEINTKAILNNKLLMSLAMKLANNGHQISLDDFDYSEKLRPLLDITNIIKIDVESISSRQVHKIISQLSDYKGQLCAKKIETRRIFEQCETSGFDLFQGFFLSHPNKISGKTIEQNKITLLQILSKLQDPDITIPVLQDLIGQDPGLSYKVMRIINSAAFSPVGRKIESLQEAIIRLGINQIRQWASLLILGVVNDKPLDIMQRSVIRAKMCELLAHKKGLENTSKYFTAGLFSSLDALLNEDMVNILMKLPLSDDLNSALMGYEGEITPILQLVLTYEKGDWERLNYDLFKAAEYKQCYLESLEWEHHITQQLTGI